MGAAMTNHRDNRVMDRLMNLPGQGEEECHGLRHYRHLLGPGVEERYERRLEALWTYHLRSVREAGLEVWEESLFGGVAS